MSQLTAGLNRRLSLSVACLCLSFSSLAVAQDDAAILEKETLGSDQNTATETSSTTTTVTETTHTTGENIVITAGLIDQAEDTNFVLSQMVIQACETAQSTQTSCRAALAFSADFQSRVEAARLLNDDLEMSAYDIGAALREQRDLLREFDALYRSTSSLVLRLVGMRSQDRLEISTLRTQNANLTTRLSRLVQAEEIASGRLAFALDELSLLQQILEDREVQIATLQAELYAVDASGEEELVRLRLALSQAQEDQANLEAELALRDARIAELELALAEAIDRRDEHLRALALEQNQRIDAQAALEISDQQLSALTIDYQALLDERDGLSITVADQAREIESLRASLAELQSQETTSTSEITTLTEERDALLVQVEIAIEARDAAEENWRIAFVDLENTRAELAAAQATMEDLESQLSQSEEALAALNEELEGQRDAQATLEEDLGNLESEQMDAGRDAERFAEELQLRDAAILILQQNLADAQGLILDLRKDLDSALSDQDSLSEEVEELTDQLSDSDATIAELQSQLEAAETEVGQGTISEAGLSDRLAAALAEIDALTLQIESLESEAEQAQVAFDDLQSRCENAGENCPLIDDEDAFDLTTIVIVGDDTEAQLRAALLELEVLKSQPYVRVENVAAWLTDKMVGREDQTAIEFEPRRFSLLQDLLFDTNSAELKPTGEQELRRLALMLRELEENPSVRQQILFAGYQTPVDWILQIAGHADPRPINGGPFADNWELAAERALTVLRFLENEGVAPDRLQAASYGDEKLVSGREFEDDINRRISFTVGIR